jgi:hypothetical protein
MKKLENAVELKATTQKSYYGKAIVIDCGEIKQLKSYDTIVCAYDTDTGIFTRFWGGFSRTTLNHVNDFRKLFNLPTLRKSEWNALPCANDTRYRVKFSNGFTTWGKEVVFDNEDDAYTYADTVCEQSNYRFGATVERV